ncbi:MAG: hypothetical protein RIT81_24670 [Deltaproteobacteria bacterium]
MTIVNNNRASDFQFETFSDLVGAGEYGGGLSAALRRKFGNLPPELMILLMRILEDGQINGGPDGDDTKDIAKLKKEACISTAELHQINSAFQGFLSNWSEGHGSVEAYMSILGLDELQDETLKAQIAQMLMDGYVTSDEAMKLADLGVIDKADADAFAESANWVMADGNKPTSSLSREAKEYMFGIGITGQYSFGDTMLMLMLLMMQLFQKRIEDMSSAVAEAQLKADVSAAKYRALLANAPADRESDDYAAWSREKEALKMDMDHDDDEVQQLMAELKRVMDKYDTLEKMFQGILDQIGASERAMAQKMDS